MMRPASGSARAQVRSARAFVVTMGVVALFGDMTYEGARGLVGPYLALLGASATAVGFAAGFGEFLGYGLRLLTGPLADRTGRHWPIVYVGYALNLVAVPGMALVGSWEAAITLLLLERVGKAVRSPARSVLVSHAASRVGAGWGFGLDELLDQIGAVVGPLLTALAIWVVRAEPAATRYQVAFAVLLLPVACNLGSLVFARRRFPAPEAFEIRSVATARPAGSLLRWYLIAAMLLGLGFADWALLAFHATRSGLLGVDALPLLYAGVMAVDAVAALIFGLCFDRWGLTSLAIGACISAFSAPFAFSFTSGAYVALGAAIWGVGMGAQESIFKATIVKLVPDPRRRGRAYGTFFAWFGLAWWLGSALMGWLYARSPTLLIAFSVVTQLAAVPPLLWIAHRLPREPGPATGSQ